MYCVNCGEVKRVIDKYNPTFKSYFGKSLWEFTDKLMLMAGIFQFDIFAFEEYITRYYGYVKDGTSIRDFVDKKFGSKACELIEKLLEE